MAEPAAPPSEGESAHMGKHKKPPKVKLTKAQLKLLKQLEAIALKKKMMRDQFIREIDLTNKSLKRGKIEWEVIIKPIRVVELRGEMEEWAQKSEFLLMRKEEKINTLLNTLKETSEIHEKAFTKHMDHVQYLENCHATLMYSAQEAFENQVLDKISDFLFALEESAEIRGHTITNTENIMHSSNVVTKDRLKKNYEGYMNNKFDKVASEIETRYILRDDTALKMRALQDQLLQWITVLQGDMVDVNRTKKYKFLMDRQRNYMTESERVNALEANSIKYIDRLKRKMLDIEEEANKRILELKLEQAYFYEVRGRIKSGIDRNSLLTYERLQAVASSSFEVARKLKDIVKKGELLLNLGACCRKYQTEAEKINPISETPVDPLTMHNEFLFKFQFDLLKYFDLSEEELAEHFGVMKNFWGRVANAGYHILLLKQEREKLIEENERYQNIIRSLKKSDDVNFILTAMSVKRLEIIDRPPPPERKQISKIKQRKKKN